VRDAWRQYRHRPLAIALTAAVPALTILVAAAPLALQALVQVAALVLGFLLELFLVAYLAGALGVRAQPAPDPGDQPPPAADPGRPQPGVAEAWAATRRSILPGLRAELLRLSYVLAAILGSLLLLGGVQEDSVAQRTRLLTGSSPLIGFMLAFLVVLRQPIVLHGERRVLAAAALSHRVASSWFPLCLGIGLIDAAAVAVGNLPLRTGMVVLLGAAGALAQPYLVGISNALYLRTRDQVSRPRS